MRLKTRVGLSIGFSGFFYAYVVNRALLEIMAEGAESGRLFGSYSWQWVAVFAAIILYGLIAVGTSLALAARPHRIFKIHANLQKRIPGWLAWASFVFGTIIMVYFMFVHRYSDHLRTAGIRWMIIIPWLVGKRVSRQPDFLRDVCDLCAPGAHHGLSLYALLVRG